jgi:hypothetical protein
MAFKRISLWKKSSVLTALSTPVRHTVKEAHGSFFAKQQEVHGQNEDQHEQ